MIENTILRRNRQGEQACVLLLTFPSTELVELAAIAGFEAVHLDGEHGAFSPESVDLLCRVAHGYGLGVTARVPHSAADTINLFLDRGVQGIIGPHVETGEQARALVDACLYPPDGWRSWGRGRGTELNDLATLDARYGGRQGFARWANANMLVFAQIESRRGWEELDSILAVPGLTGITGGPNDLAASLGYPGQPEHPACQAAAEDVERRARAAGKALYYDLVATLDFQDFLLRSGRAFVAEHRPLGSQAR